MSALAEYVLPRIREMSRADVPAVTAIEKRGYDFPWSIINFDDCLRTGYQCRVLELQDTIIGYSVMLMGVDECHLLNLCIDPDYRRCGHGRTFLQEIIQHAALCGMRRMMLEVRPTNRAALSMYLSEGFKQVGTRKNYYPKLDGREDALVLARNV